MRWIIVLLLFPTFLHAQDCRISGRLIDAATSEPLIGANAFVTYRTAPSDSLHISGAATKADGAFTILFRNKNFPASMTLQTSCLGYKKWEFQLAGYQSVQRIAVGSIALKRDPYGFEGVIIDVIRRPMIDSDRANFRTVIYQEDIERLPIR